MDDNQSELYQTHRRFIKSLSSRNLSSHTATAYRTDIWQFLSFLSDNDVTVVSPLQISRTHIIDFLSYLSGRGRSGVTSARKLASIREYCKFLLAERIIERSPAEQIAMPKKERKARVYLRVDEYMRLLSAALGNTRDYAVLQLFLQTGIRVSELTNLKITDIDLTEQTMLINGKGKKQRTVNLEKKATQALKNYLSVRPTSLEEHLFLNYQGTKLSVRGVVDIVEKYRKRAGITKGSSANNLMILVEENTF